MVHYSTLIRFYELCLKYEAFADCLRLIGVFYHCNTRFKGVQRYIFYAFCKENERKYNFRLSKSPIRFDFATEVLRR